MATDEGKDPGLPWGIAGSVLVLAGMLFLLISNASGAGTWRNLVVAPLVVGGALCTLMAFLVRRRAGRSFAGARKPPR